MREEKLYGNLTKYVLCAPEIQVLGKYVSMDGVGTDPEKYLVVLFLDHHSQEPHGAALIAGSGELLSPVYKNYAELIQPLASLLKKDVA